MPSIIVQGATITLDAFVRDVDGLLVSPVDPRVSIVDPHGVTQLSLAVPSEPTTGHLVYAWPVPADAELGGWAVDWSATVDGAPLTDEDVFTVVGAGSIVAGSDARTVTCSAWATLDDIGEPCSSLSMSADLMQNALYTASDVLFNLTGRRWPGVCSDSIRPIAQWRQHDGPPRWWPSTSSSTSGWCSCNRSQQYGCATVPEISLPGHPVLSASIVVRIDGVTLDPSQYRLDDHHKLVRIDGEGWPCCQDLTADDATDLHTFAVDYDFGLAPPIGGVFAAAELACQMALSRDPVNSGACALPKRITSITRQGETITILDPLHVFDDGKTGIPSIDLWIASERYGAKSRRSAVLLPGRQRVARRVGQ